MFFHFSPWIHQQRLMLLLLLFLIFLLQDSDGLDSSIAFVVVANQQRRQLQPPSQHAATNQYLNNKNTHHHHNTVMSLSSSASSAAATSFKPAALPLMDAGKAMARVGEMWVDVIQSSEFIESTSTSNNSNQKNQKNTASSYSPLLYACGVQLRNAGDAMAQAAANGRFAYGMEMTSNELRESAACMASATKLLQQYQQQQQQHKVEKDGNGVDNLELCKYWSNIMECTIAHLETCHIALEAAGASILQRRPYATVGQKLTESGQALYDIAQVWDTNSGSIDDGNDDKEGSSSVTSTKPIPQSLTSSCNALGRQFATVGAGVMQAGNNLQPSPTSDQRQQTPKKLW